MKKKIIILISILALICLIISLIWGNRIIDNIYIISSRIFANSEQTSAISYLIYDNQNNSDLKVLVKIVNDDGIEYIQKNDGNKIITNNKKMVTFDIKMPLNVSQGNITIKTKYGIEKKELIITESEMESQLEIAVEKPNKNSEDTTTKIYTYYNMKNDSDVMYYKLNQEDEWTRYNDKFIIDDSIEETDIYLKKEDKTGNLLFFNKKVQIDIPNFITFGDVLWSNEKASTTLLKGPDIVENTTTEYLIKDNKQNKWTKMDGNEETITNLLHGNVIFVRMIDENNKIKASVSLTILDEKVPNDASVVYTKLKNGGTGEEFDISSTDEIITITVGDIVKANITVNDEESGINLQNCRWQFSTKKTPIGTNPYDYENIINSKTIEIEQKLTGVDGARYLHVLSCDKVGNYKETIITEPIVVVTGGDGLDVFDVAGASVFDDVTGSQIGPIYKENYKVGASINRDNVYVFSNAWGSWSTKINASQLFGELNIEKISKLRAEFTYQVLNYNGGGESVITGLNVFIKYER